MTALTPVEVSVTDFPIDKKYASSVKTFRRQIVAIRGTATATTDTINIATYVPDVQDIEGVVWNTMNNTQGTAFPTWSTTTLTLANYGSPGTMELGILVNFGG